MADLFNLLKISFTRDTVVTDNFIFQMHYKITVLLLSAFTTMTLSNKYIGRPLACVAENVNSQVLETYCWIHTVLVPISEGDSHGLKDSFQLYQLGYVVFLLLGGLMFFTHPWWESIEGCKTKSKIDSLKHPDGSSRLSIDKNGKEFGRLNF